MANVPTVIFTRSGDTTPTTTDVHPYLRNDRTPDFQMPVGIMVQALIIHKHRIRHDAGVQHQAAM